MGIDANDLIAAISRQRNEAMDSVAVKEAENKGLKKQLEEAIRRISELEEQPEASQSR